MKSEMKTTPGCIHTSSADSFITSANTAVKRLITIINSYNQTGLVLVWLPAQIHNIHKKEIQTEIAEWVY